VAFIFQQNVLQKQGIVGPTFTLDDVCNLVNSEPRLPDRSIYLILIIILAVDPWLHSAMDKYAMFAVTCSYKYLDMYIDIIKAENEIWVTHREAGLLCTEAESKVTWPYMVSFTHFVCRYISSVLLPEYELVVLQPDHFLPDDSLLHFYSRRTDHRVLGVHHYEMADRVLRKFPGNDTSERFPSFQFKGLRAFLGHAINPYVVVLAAEIKFRGYLAANGPELPQDYKSLMDKTIEVAELLYFQPARPLPTFYHPFEVDMTLKPNSMTRRWVFGLVPTTSLVVPLLDRRGDPPLAVVEQDMQTLTIGAICSLAAVGSSFFFNLLWASLLIPSIRW
jgi:hypothetical protein